MSAPSVETFRHSSARPWTYADLELRQAAIRASVLRGESGRLLFSEVAPVITLGFRKTEEDLLLSREEYARKGIALLEVSRGGRATYHGPGQWVIFPVETLERLTGDRRGVRKVVTALLEAIREVALERFPCAEIRDGKEAGVWTEPGLGGAKFSALGIRIVDGIVQHGVSVNIFETAESFSGIRPCGLEGAVAFLEESADVGERNFERWREKLTVSISKRFACFSC